MSEIRLQCPGCGTEYHLPEGSIPHDGRRVECTSCDHVWLAFEENHGASGDINDDPLRENDVADVNNTGIIRHDLPKSPDQPDETQGASNPVATPAPASRRIPESVLSILREEVEFERRARRGEITENSSGDVDQDLSTEDWPATTVTGDVPQAVARTIPLPPRPLDKTSKDNTASVADPSAEKKQSKTGSTPPAAKDSVRSPEPGPSGEHPRKGAYIIGFGTALAAAAAAVGLYIIAPTLSADDRFGPEITEYREIVDSGRDWLAQQTNQLIPGD